MELSAGQISAAAAPGEGVRRPSGPGSAQPSLQAQAVYLQRAGCSGTQGGVDTPLQLIGLSLPTPAYLKVWFQYEPIKNKKSVQDPCIHFTES